jgi:hypothetical protein
MTALLTEFPLGGPWLRAEVARAVEEDPSLTADAVFIAGIGNAYQRQAIRLGLVDAANFFASIGSDPARDAARRIWTALGPDDPDICVGLCLSQLPEAVQGVPGFGKTAPAATPTCVNPTVSPSKPNC